MQAGHAHFKFIGRATALQAIVLLAALALVVGVNHAAESARVREEASENAHRFESALMFALADVPARSQRLDVDAVAARMADHGFPHPVEIRSTVDLYALDELSRKAFRSQAAAHMEQSGRLELAYPLIHDSAVIAVARTGTAVSATKADATEFLTRNLILAPFVLLAFCPLLYGALIVATRPLQNLANLADRLLNRDYNARFEFEKTDRVKPLGDALFFLTEEVCAASGRIQELVRSDELTGLPNAGAFREQLRQTLRAADGEGALILVNLDRFKRLNDTFGEAVGDEILIQAAQRLRRIAADVFERMDHFEAKQPVVARLYGDQFAILLCCPAVAGVAKHLSNAICEVMREPMAVDDRSLSLTARIGFACFPEDASDEQHLMRNANFALDATKEASNGGSSERFSPTMTRAAVERATIENELRHALRRGEFEVHYQPKVLTASTEIVGCEALVRWWRDGKIVSPAAFIPIAEETGQIAAIGRFVMAEACRAAKRWANAGTPVHVAVNVSAVQVEDASFARQVLDTLRVTGLPPEYLEIELTETIAAKDPEQLQKQVAPLRAKGVRFAIDDFGTGHSNLGALTELPFDVLKVDQSFIRRIHEENGRVVVEATLALAQALGYETVAEGVESEEQYHFLRMNRCTHIQGWLFGKPVPEAEFVKLLAPPEVGSDETPKATGTDL